MLNMPSPIAQVVKNAKQSQARKARGAGAGGAAYADEAPAGDAPRRWSDYTVHFHFPEPTEVGSTSLLQARPDAPRIACFDI